MKIENQKMMKAAMFYGVGDVRLTQTPVPTINDDEVLIEVKAALTCASDLKAFRQGHPVLLGDQYPSPFGHECSGLVAKTGKNVKHIKVGQRVVAANSAPCDECAYCKDEKPNLCDNLDLLNGAYASFIKVPKRIVKHNLYVLADHVPFEHAALTEPLACSVHAYDSLMIRPGQTVAILGCGMMGLLFLAYAAGQGAKVIAIGKNEKKLSLAKKLGAYKTIHVQEHLDPLKEAIDLTPDGIGAHVVLEAIGQVSSWEDSMRLVRKGGTVCLFGGCKKGSHFSIDTHKVHYQEITLKGVFHHTPKHFAKALDLITRGFVNPSDFIEGSLSLEELGDYFQASLNKSFYKTVVRPS